jgi:hypothetical protein
MAKIYRVMATAPGSSVIAGAPCAYYAGDVYVFDSYEAEALLRSSEGSKFHVISTEEIPDEVVEEQIQKPEEVTNPEARTEILGSFVEPVHLTDDVNRVPGSYDDTNDGLTKLQQENQKDGQEVLDTLVQTKPKKKTVKSKEEEPPEKSD